MIKRLENLLRNNPRYSVCMCCGGAWNWKKSHNTMYSESGGMFPLCEDCYQKLTPKERLPFYRQLWISWGAPSKVDWGLVKKNIGFDSSTQSKIKEN